MSRPSKKRPSDATTTPNGPKKAMSPPSKKHPSDATTMPHSPKKAMPSTSKNYPSDTTTTPNSPKKACTSSEKPEDKYGLWKYLLPLPAPNSPPTDFVLPEMFLKPGPKELKLRFLLR
ncbi:unnamed protein product, partial [Mesorhabditis spiculigera]